MKIKAVSLFSCSSTRRTDITIVYTTSIEGEYESCGCPKHPLGGISKRAKYVDELRKRLFKGTSKNIELQSIDSSLVNNGIIVTAGSRGKYIGVLRLTFYGNKPYKLTQDGKESGTITYSEEWVPVEQELENNSTIDKLMRIITKRLRKLTPAQKLKR